MGALDGKVAIVTGGGRERGSEGDFVFRERAPQRIFDGLAILNPNLCH